MISRLRGPVLSPESQAGFILIASLAMLVVLAGTVLVCLYPVAQESRQAPRHREALRRLKTAERGIFGRLADQPGGVHSAAGGFISDLGPKMIVEKLVDEKPATYEVTRLSRAMEFWFFRRFSKLPDLVNSKSDGNSEGCDDIYRYDLDRGFWRGFRGKRYVRRPPGEEHFRKREPDYKKETEEFHQPRFYTGGSDIFMMELAGGSAKDTFFLKMTDSTSDHDLTNSNLSRSESNKIIEHTRYYNPVERFVVRVNDRREPRRPLSARLVYAQQPDPDDADELGDLYPDEPSEVVIDEIIHEENNLVDNGPNQWATDGITTIFTFYWNSTNEDDGKYMPVHTFEIGLKKLILMEKDGEAWVPVFACGITIPPVRECQCEENDPRISHHTGCGQPFSDQYVVEIDYDG